MIQKRESKMMMIKKMMEEISQSVKSQTTAHIFIIIIVTDHESTLTENPTSDPRPPITPLTPSRPANSNDSSIVKNENFSE